MKYPLLLMIVFSGGFIFGQANNNGSLSVPATGGNTYAVIVGISTYASPGIPQLSFAHRDAQFFADYLKSKAGGQVPEENIRLLLNENASFAAIYDALDWLLNTCQKNDLVYFYFSGHGDMENSTIYKLGFLLSYNTPRTNYINNAVRIEDLNNFANTLSVKVNAKVVLITDACHSGKLAGSDFRGTFLAGDQLRATRDKEIRITSCAPDQLSAEDEGWGGGRGVFSYYLVNGLEGMADINHDKTVTVSEIKNYLDSSLATDGLLAQKAMKQSPVVKGNSIFSLALIDDKSLAALKQQSAAIMVNSSALPMVAGALKPLPPQPQAYFFNFLQQHTPENMLNFSVLNKLSKEEIPFACLRMMMDSARNYPYAFGAGGNNLFPDSQQTERLEKTFRDNKDALARFSNKLAVVLSDRGQEIINNLLEGDAAELERRRYYNSLNSGYEVYPDMFSVALKLVQPQDYLYRLLQIKLHYFSGVAARLKMPAVADPQSLIAFALAEQEKAFKLEENAAYILNELGTLYLIKNMLPAAEKKLMRATQIAPKWAVPWSNLAILYASSKKYTQAKAAALTATTLQPELQNAWVNMGMIDEQTGNQLQAEDMFRKSILLNSRHYLPFERLGYVYMKTTQYALADSFFYEADKRKKGFHFNYVPMVFPKFFIEPATVGMGRCPIDTNEIGKLDVIGNFVWAMLAYRSDDAATAERKFKEVIALDKSHPLAFHYLGRLLYKQERWQEAAIVFDLSRQYFLDSAALNDYALKKFSQIGEIPSRDCIIQEFRSKQYDYLDNFYFSGQMYEHWNHFAEAETQYRQIIELQPGGTGGYYLLWNMLEKIKRYDDAEKVLESFAFMSHERGDPELNLFYKRMIQRLPDAGYWYYKAGMFLYHIAEKNPQRFWSDLKKIEIDSDNEIFINQSHEAEAVISFRLPGYEDEIIPARAIEKPFTDGIAWLRMADSLLQQNDDAIADINYKMGDLYVWQGLGIKSTPFYIKALVLQPNNANTRLKLVDVYDKTFQLINAMAQLDSLYARSEIDFDKQVLMAKYYIHESHFEEAGKLLSDAQQVHPYNIPAITDLNGRLNWLSGQPKKAIELYKNYLAMQPGDAATMYTIARIYAKTGDATLAWSWLEKAMAKGFRCGWVMKFDNLWDSYRKQGKWNDLQKRYPAKMYANNDM